jgi:hypothetical protein
MLRTTASGISGSADWAGDPVAMTNPIAHIAAAPATSRLTCRIAAYTFSIHT